MDVANFIDKILNLLTLFSDLFILALIFFISASAFVLPLRNFLKKILKSSRKYYRILAFIVALTATGGSLFYSEIMKFTPCLLCWYQRILMYPQVLLIGTGILKNDKNATDYSLVLSIPGAIIALYHYYLQRGGNKIIPCSSVGFSVDCAKNFTMNYGYITIPMMSLTAFTLITVLMVLYKIKNDN